MARKMSASNEALFAKLEALVPEEYRKTSGTLRRWVQTCELDKTWLKSVKFEKNSRIIFDRINQFAIASFDNEKYLLSCGLDLDFTGDDFEVEEVNSGLFCAAISELDIEPNFLDNIGLLLAEEIFTQNSGSALQGQDYPLESISKYFPKMYLYKIPSNSPFLRNLSTIYRIGLFAATRCKQLLYLDWSQESLEVVRDASATANDLFPHELALNAITARKWEHAFLEIYRAMEFLYSFPRINKLREKLSLSIPTHEVSEVVEEVLGWRPSESDALHKLLKNLPQQLHADFKLAIPDPTERTTENMTGRLIYRIRNECVHFRPIQKSSDIMASVQWKVLLEAMTKATCFCYREQIVLPPP